MKMYSKRRFAKKLMEGEGQLPHPKWHWAYTSQTCSKCGYIDKRNRKNQETFICGFCHKKQNADINASKNILARSSSEL
jgi:putative transposase